MENTAGGVLLYTTRNTHVTPPCHPPSPSEEHRTRGEQTVTPTCSSDMVSNAARGCRPLKVLATEGNIEHGNAWYQGPSASAPIGQNRSNPDADPNQLLIVFEIQNPSCEGQNPSELRVQSSFGPLASADSRAREVREFDGCRADMDLLGGKKRKPPAG